MGYIIAADADVTNDHCLIDALFLRPPVGLTEVPRWSRSAHSTAASPTKTRFDPEIDAADASVADTGQEVSGCLRKRADEEDCRAARAARRASEYCEAAHYS